MNTKIQILSVGACVLLVSAGCQSNSRKTVPTGAPQAAVSLSALNQVDPPDAVMPHQPPAVMDLPCDYELIWRATGGANGHWIMRRVTTGGDAGRVRVRMSEAGRSDAENLQPAYIEQEMARLLVAMQGVNAAQAQQMVQVMAEIRRLRDTAEANAKSTILLSGKLAEKELELRALREQAAQASGQAVQAAQQNQNTKQGKK